MQFPTWYLFFFFTSRQYSNVFAFIKNNNYAKRTPLIRREAPPSSVVMFSRKNRKYYSDRDMQYINNNNDDDNNNNKYHHYAVDDDVIQLQERLEQMKVQYFEEEYRRPPNVDLSPIEFVTEFLRCLQNNDDPVPDAGIRMMIRSSTKHWRKLLYNSIGAPENADIEVVAVALSEAITRPHNQFGLLMGSTDDGCVEEYVPYFNFEPLDYNDGTCWVECQLRDKNTDTLLATTGWSLEKINGAWMVDNIDWQDFREEYRPGIGREEWMRICG